MGAAQSLDQMALRQSVIKSIHQIMLNTQHTCKVYLRKNGNVHQGVPLAVAHSPGAIGNVGWLLESISMVAHRGSGNKIDNIMVVRELIIFCTIKNHSDSPITISDLIW